MAKTTGHLLKRGDVYQLRYMVNGRLKQVSLGTTNRREAERKRDELLGVVTAAKTKEEIAVHVGEARKLIRRSGLDIASAWKIYAASPRRPDSSPGTLGNYQRNWERFAAWIAEDRPHVTHLDAITESDASDYFAVLASTGISAPTFNYHRQSVSLVWKTLLPDMSNPFRNVKRKTEDKTTRKAFTPDEAAKVIAAAESDAFHSMEKAELVTLLRIGAGTGLRLADACALRWNAVDFLGNVISLKPQKTRRQSNKLVRIPMLPWLRSDLEMVKARAGDSPYVMPVMVERHKSNPNGVVRSIQKAVELSGLDPRGDLPDGIRRRPAYGFHSFRHCFASAAAQAGVPIHVLADLLGDNPRTLERYYIKIGDAAKRDAMATLTVIPSAKDSIPALPAPPSVSADAKLRMIEEALASACGSDISNDLRIRIANILAE